MTLGNTNDIPRVGRESLITERLPLNGARVVDIGCGEGWLTQLVAPICEAVIGIDPSETALERARAANNSGNETYLLASADKLPIDDSWADVAVYFNSLHHIPAGLQRKAAAETARILVPDGVLCIVEPMASGSAYELFKPVEDEAAVYASSYLLILDLASGADFRQEAEEVFVDSYNFRNFEAFLDHVLVVDERREKVLTGQENMLRDHFDQLGEAIEAGRSYDQVHRLSLLHRL